MTTKRPQQAGFTLLEILLALTIMGFITSILWGSFGTTAHIKKRTEAAQERAHAARVALARMTREIEMAFLSASEDLVTQQRRTMFIGTSHSSIDDLLFSYFGHQRLRADVPESDTAIVSYYAEADPEDRGVMNLMRRETRRLEAKEPRSIPGESYILCPAITQLKFSFYDYKNKQWREEWNTVGVDGFQYLPTHVRITLGLLDERGQEAIYTSAARLQMTERVDYRPNRT